MSLDRERLLSTQLRILGILLIVVGFTIIARGSERSGAGDQTWTDAKQVCHASDRPDRVRIEIQRVRPLKRAQAPLVLEDIKTPKPPPSPKLPKPPRPPLSASARTISFVN